MQELLGLKELEDVVIKATYPIEIGHRKIETNEIILAFDNIQIAGLNELKSKIDARGGFGNRSWVYWETTKEMSLDFTQGVFSIEHLSLISNSKIGELDENKDVVILTARDCHESSEFGIIELKQVPVGNLFVYDKETGEKLDYRVSGRQVIIEEPFKEVYVTYEWEYKNGGKVIRIGKRLLNGYLKLDAKTRLKEDKNGQVHTGIIHIPKLKLMSDLSIRLGENVAPTTVNFSAAAIPVGGKGTSYVCNFIALNDDIDKF